MNKSKRSILVLEDTRLKRNCPEYLLTGDAPQVRGIFLLALRVRLPKFSTCCLVEVESLSVRAVDLAQRFRHDLPARDVEAVVCGAQGNNGVRDSSQRWGETPR